MCHHHHCDDAFERYDRPDNNKMASLTIHGISNTVGPPHIGHYVTAISANPSQYGTGQYQIM